jgi:hypothetical protein
MGKKYLKLRTQLRRHVPIFDQPKSYSCDVGVCKQTNLRDRGSAIRFRL